jgi:ornithine carbamoyltransferase
MYDGIEYRGFSQATADTLGIFAGVPVWNGLTDQWHPTQSMRRRRDLVPYGELADA